MPDTTTTEPAVDTPQDGPETASEATEGTDKGGREAAKYRRRLRDTETERDQLAERVAALQRGEAERVAASTLAKPAELWAAGVTVADLLDEAGSVDAAKVRAAATQAAADLGLATPKATNYVASEGRNPQATPGAPRFEDALRQG